VFDQDTVIFWSYIQVNGIRSRHCALHTLGGWPNCYTSLCLASRGACNWSLKQTIRYDRFTNINMFRKLTVIQNVACMGEIAVHTLGGWPNCYTSLCLASPGACNWSLKQTIRYDRFTNINMFRKLTVIQNVACMGEIAVSVY